MRIAIDNSNNKALIVVMALTGVLVDKATQAYKLFSEGKKPIEVAIALGLDRKETIASYYSVSLMST
jgi:hypothetical protein